MQKEKRRYSGQSFEDRQTERRARLVRAALDVSGKLGREGASVAAICAEAGLTARYFYESFPSRDAIFVEAYRAVVDQLLGAVERAIDPADPVRSALVGFFAALASRPGPARVFLLDLDDRDPELRAASRDGAMRLARLFAPDVEDRLMMVGIIGAIVQIARNWITFGFTEPVEAVAIRALAFARVRE